MYIDSAAIEEVASGGEGIKNNFKELAEKIKAILPEDAVREREIITAQQDICNELVAKGMDGEEAANIIAENPVLVTWKQELGAYISENGELNITDEQANLLIAKFQNDPLISVLLASNDATVSYLSDADRAKQQFWGAVFAVKHVVGSAADALQFANDLAGETLYYASGKKLYQTEHENFHQTVNDIIYGVAAMANDPVKSPFLGPAISRDFRLFFWGLPRGQGVAPALWAAKSIGVIFPKDS